MATIVLSKSAQSQLGSVHHRRLKLIHSEARQLPDWMEPDEQPPNRGMTIDQCHRGMLVTELISPHRKGKIIGFKKSFPYAKLPLVKWEPFGVWASSQSTIHPAVIEERAEPPEFEQLRLF